MEVDLKTPAAEEDNGVGNEEHVSSAIPSDRSPMAASSRSPSSDPGDFVINNKGQLKSTKAEIGKVREENARLKMTLAQTIKDYQSLQMHFFNVVQQDEAKWPVGSAPAPNEVEESELVSLTLGTSSSGHKMEDKNNSTSKGKDDKNSSEGPKEEEPGEPWPPSKIPKDLSNGDDEVLQQPQVKKARVCVRTRCDSPTMNDGCQWRKYGQKIAKGNPCPRAYYRCNVAPGCPVRKQVQRCAKDRSMLMTTYEGTHNHPLPVSATAMASTTSAAACMLLSGSSTSQLPTASLASAATANLATASANLNDLSFGLLSDMSRPRQLHLPYPSVSSTTSHPTVTLDLTAPQASSTSQANQFNWFSSSFTTPTTFNFSNWESHSMPTAWSSGCLSYGSHQPNKSSALSLSLGRQSQEDFYQTHLKKATNLNAPTANQHPLTDTIAKAITTDPSFQSALAAAVTSHIGALGTEEHFNSGNGCASSYLNRSTSTSSNMQERNCLFLQPSLAFPSTNSDSASPVDNTENIK